MAFRVRDLMVEVLPMIREQDDTGCDAGCSGGTGCTNVSGHGTPNCELLVVSPARRLDPPELVELRAVLQQALNRIELGDTRDAVYASPRSPAAIDALQRNVEDVMRGLDRERQQL